MVAVVPNSVKQKKVAAQTTNKFNADSDSDTQTQSDFEFIPLPRAKDMVGYGEFADIRLGLHAKFEVLDAQPEITYQGRENDNLLGIPTPVHA